MIPGLTSNIGEGPARVNHRAAYRQGIDSAVRIRIPGRDGVIGHNVGDIQPRHSADRSEVSADEPAT